MVIDNAKSFLIDCKGYSEDDNTNLSHEQCDQIIKDNLWWNEYIEYNS